MTRHLWAAALLLAVVAPLRAADADDYTRNEDIVYGRKFGTALTLDVFKPKGKTNGAAVIVAVSGGWFSAHEAINPAWAREFLNRGYTVFFVVHGSQPKFTIPEAVDDMRRAVRFIRSKATDFGIDPERIGVTGGSAGGHLSLMLGTAGRDGDPKAKDPVDRFSSRVQAVGCFFPPTDFLNYGEKGHVALGTGTLKNFFAPFDFKEFDATTRAFERVSDEEKRKEIGRQISPAVQANDKSAPSLIIHGDADKLVPIQQAEVMVEALKKAGVPAELVVKKGAAHGWPGLDKDLVLIADWFDRHLNKKDSKETNDGK